MSRRVRRLGGLGRVALAVALLAVLWMGTVFGVRRASVDADTRRERDRLALAEAFAASVREWIEGGAREAEALAAATADRPVQGALDAYVASSPGFGRDALHWDRGLVTAATGAYGAIAGLAPKPCVRVDESGGRSTDDGLHELAESPGGTRVSRIFDAPGTCKPVVAVAAPARRGVVVVLADPDDAQARLRAAALIPDAVHDRGDRSTTAGTRIFLVNGASALEPGVGPRTPPARVIRFVSEAQGSPRTARYPIGRRGSAEVVAAVHPVTGSWSVVLEQDAAVFEIETQNQPWLVVSTLLTVVFGAVFLLIAWFDVRRRRAHRRAEVAKNAFFSVAGHELRTPLTSLKGFTETLAARWDDVDDDRRRALVERMLPQARRLDRLVERLLVAASIQAETHTHPQVRPTPVGEILADVAGQFRSEAPLHTFEVTVEPGLPEAEADPRALQQVLEHLVDNAIKYSPSGGRVGIAARTAKRGIGIAVEDEGVGLPSDHRRIFEKFAQGESVTKRVHDEGGVGLGLYIVRTLVEEMGGAVRAERREPSGARFVVTLRAVRPCASAPVARTSSISP